MANTTDITLSPENGWTAVATDPTALTVHSNTGADWHLAITDDGNPPAVDLVGEVHRGYVSWESGAITGTVYLRATANAHSFAVTAQA